MFESYFLLYNPSQSNRDGSVGALEAYDRTISHRLRYIAIISSEADSMSLVSSDISLRFEQKGLISLSNLIKLAIALQYTSEIKDIFSKPKYSTMEELSQIRKNANKKKAHTPSLRHNNEKD